MKSFFLLAAVLLLGSAAINAQTIHSIDIGVGLGEDGTLFITQRWDVTVDSGTEWYVPIENLDGEDVFDLRVSEGEKEFESDGRGWDSSRSAVQKEGRCGIVDKGRNGVELCWGQGGFGHHVWTVRFAVKGVVRSLEDYDAFNFMFINDSQPSPVGRASILFSKISGEPLSQENTRFWFFGCSGESKMTETGDIYFETDTPMTYDNGLIAMMRFDKGLFAPERSRDIKFEKMQKKAFKGSSYSGKGSSKSFYDWLLIAVGFLFIGLFALLGVGFVFLVVRDIVLRVLGRIWSPKTFGSSKLNGWYREPPFDGSIPEAAALLFEGERLLLHVVPSERAIGAYFLKWIKDGLVTVEKDGQGHFNLQFPEEKPAFGISCEEALYNMALEAAGKNRLLEKDEFSKWSKVHYKAVLKWPDKVIAAGKEALSPWIVKKGSLNLNEEGRAEAAKLLQFKNFLSDFTIASEKEAPEVNLWGEYLVFAQLFGIADKVQEGLAKLYPDEFADYSERLGVPRGEMSSFVHTWTALSKDASRVAQSEDAERSGGSSGGFGGRSSIGGGGGFSGGGHGGGSR